MPDLYDVTIVGAGPAGLYAAYYAGFRKLRTKIIDSLAEAGGQITALYAEKGIYDVAGFTAIAGKDLVRALWDQARQYDPTVCLGEQATDLRRRDDGTWLLTTDKGEHATRTLLLASGIGLFTPRKLGNPVFEAFEGSGLSYVMEDPEDCRGKRVAIVGGGDSAVDWANHLAEIAETVYVIHRRDEFRAHEASVDRMRAHAQLKTPGQVKEIRGDGQIEEIVLAYTDGAPDETLQVDILLAFLGFISNPGPIAEWGLAMNKQHILINQKCETNLPGVYAIGDCAGFEGKPKLISVGFGEAATAVNNAAVFLDPRKNVFPGHSSNLKSPTGL